LFPDKGTIFIAACFEALAVSPAGNIEFIVEKRRRCDRRRAGEFLMIDKKTPGSSPTTPETGPASEQAKKRTPNVKDHIGRQLRALYDEVAAQPVPDRFMELLNRLDVKNGDE